MRKSLTVSAVLCTLSYFFFPFEPTSANADVELPESRRLGGTIDPAISELGDEFWNFPELFGERPPAGTSRLSGWLEIRFGEPQDGRVEFTLDYHMRGTADLVEFGGGQRYDQSGIEAHSEIPPGLPFANRGVLDLKTGEVSEIQIGSIWNFSTVARVTRVNRIPNFFPAAFPAPAAPPPLSQDMAALAAQMPPNFIFREARFEIGADSRIRGFSFRGMTVAPIGRLSELGLFPPISFGPEGGFFMGHPHECAPETPPERCPDLDSAPDGVPLPKQAFFHPRFYFGSSDLRELPAEDASSVCTIEASEIESVRDDSAAAPPGAARVRIDEELWILGGAVDERAVAEVWIVDASGKRRAGPRLPEPTTDAVGVFVDGRIELAGGRRTARGPSAATRWAMTPEEGVWRPSPDLLFPVARASALRRGDEIVLAGGFVQASTDAYPGVSSEILQTITPHRAPRLCGEGPILTADGVLNAAGLAVGPRPLAPGALALVEGSRLAGASIEVDGQVVPVLFASPRRVDFLVPADLKIDGAARITVRTPAGETSVDVPVAPAAPGIFVESYGETRAEDYLVQASAIACNGDGAYNYAASPAPPGGELVLRVSGLGIAPQEREIVLKIDGEPAEIVGLSPTKGPPGMFDLRVRVPAGVRTANRVPVVLETPSGNGVVRSNVAAAAIGESRTSSPIPCLVLGAMELSGGT